MKPQRFKPLLYSRKRSELSLSSESLTKLLKAVLEKGRLFRFRAKGFSMSPFIRDGDVLTLSPLKNGSPSIGKVVAIIHPITGKLIVHRVIRRKSDSYVMKGDNLPDADIPVKKIDILGYVMNVERNGKRVFVGLGFERLFIAFLSRKKLLIPLICVLRNIRDFLPGRKRLTKITNNH